MAKASAQFTKDNEYYTPTAVVNYFGQFDYDPATTPDKAAEFNIKTFDTIETNGLATDWTLYKKIWVNPPFTRKHQFILKAHQTFTIAKNEIYVLFPIEFLTTKRFADIGCKGKFFIPSGRINFESGLGKKSKSPAFGSIVMKLQEYNQIEFINIRDLRGPTK